MPKFFVTSDIHSFWEPFKKALDESGFNPENESHWLIVCGDTFDRGSDSVKVYDYLMSLKRCILVKGNHDILLRDMLQRGFCQRHDIHNGTDKTFWQLANKDTIRDAKDLNKAVYKLMEAFWNKQVNYFETQRYIFVHSWIPCKLESVPHPADKWLPITKNVWRKDWRTADDFEWEEAMWGNPFKNAAQGLNKTRKTIVFGHWHCSTGYVLNDPEHYSEFDENACWEPYINKEQKIIGVDRCTAHTGECNIIVLEDEFLESI
jgi:hypothetical protein